MDPTALLGFAVTATVLELTPGPNMSYLAVVAATAGRAAGLMAVLGVALGLALLGLLAALGVGQIILDYRPAYEVLRWGGAAYLLWLAYDAWRDSRAPLPNRIEAGALATYFRRGLVTNLLNPKAAIFYLTVMPAFTTPGAGAAPQLAVLLATYVAIATAIHAGVVLLAATLRPLLIKERLRRVAGLVFAALLVAIALWFLAGTAR